MDRIDGFLCIDGCEKVLAHEHHKKNNHYWVYINGEEYYFKPTDNCYNELIGYHAAKFLGIDTCYCDLAILNGQKGIISKSLRNEKINLITGMQILNEYVYSSISNLYWTKKMLDKSDIMKKIWFDDKYRDKSEYISNGINDLENIWHALEYKYKLDKRFNIEKVMHQIITMYIFTLLSYDTDKYAVNWSIMEYEDDIKLAPLFDNEDSFNYTKDKLNQNYRINLSTNPENYNCNQLEAIEVFLKTSSSEYYDMFFEMYEKIFNNFNKIIENAEKQIGTSISLSKKLIIVNGFYKNMHQIRNFIEEYNNNFKIK